MQIPLFQQRQLVPILATWDDHDFGKNNGGQEYKHKEESKKIFETFFAQEPAQKLNKGPGVASHFTAFDHNFVFMDNRFFRTENNKDFKNQSHWGTDQEQWLMKIINHNKTPTWIINGDQVWATYHQFESYAVNHPKNFAVVAKKMGGAKSPLFFISGDRHLAEILEVKPPRFAYKTYELTTSGLHANLYPRDEPLPAGVIDRNNNQYNYALLIPQNRSSELKVKVKVYGLGSQLLFKRNLIIKN